MALLQDDSTVLETCIDLFIVADFFVIDALCRIATDIVVEKMYEYAQVYSRSDKMPWLDHFFIVAQRVFDSGSSFFQTLEICAHAASTPHILYGHGGKGIP
jgi:hypothetical protein